MDEYGTRTYTHCTVPYSAFIFVFAIVIAVVYICQSFGMMSNTDFESIRFVFVCFFVCVCVCTRSIFIDLSLSSSLRLKCYQRNTLHLHDAHTMSMVDEQRITFDYSCLPMLCYIANMTKQTKIKIAQI